MWHFENFRLATPLSDGSILCLEHAAALVSGSKILWVGPSKDSERILGSKVTALAENPLPAPEHVDLGGRLVTPGLVDCHTHMTFAGNRAAEFARRLNGETYESIARSGGGILTTVAATRQASAQTLAALTARRLETWLQQGVTTVEIKSGYGLTLSEEMKILGACAAAREQYPGTVAPTFLGAHAIPPEFRTDRQAYVDLICQDMLPQVAAAKLATAADVFCESIAFSLEETKKILRAAHAAGLGTKLHAEQLSLSHSADLAAEFKLLSCDHLEHLDSPGAMAMQAAQSVAVLLPGSFYYLRETKKPPVAMLRELGIPIAVATDFNPGSSPLTSLLLAAHMACVFFELSVPEALQAITTHAARALGLEKSKGILQPDFDADFAVWNVESLEELFYETGSNPCIGVFANGRWLPQQQMPAQESAGICATEFLATRNKGTDS